MNRIITIQNVDTNEFFFTTDHCQDHGFGPKWVKCIYNIPMSVAPRKSLLSGVIKSVDDLVKVFYSNDKEINNPDSNYQPIFK